MNTQYQSPRWISTADTAKIVRSALKENFPGIKFSVKSKSYSGGSSIRVSWMDGPTYDAVNAVTRQYQGASFDGMVDLKSYHDSQYQGEAVHFGADYINCERSYSVEFYTKVAQWFCKKYGYPMPIIRVSEYDGSAYLDKDMYCEDRQEWFATLFYREYRQIDASVIDQLEAMDALSYWLTNMACSVWYNFIKAEETKDEADRATYIETELLPHLEAQLEGFEKLGDAHAVEVLSKSIAHRKDELATLSQDQTVVTVLEDDGYSKKVRVLQPGQAVPFKTTVTGELAFYLKRYNARVVSLEEFDYIVETREIGAA